MNKKKIAIILSASAAAAALTAGGVFATFSDNAVIQETGTAGSVDIDVSNFKLSNANNINPGDHDIYMQDDPSDPRNAGTEHKLTFDVANLGTKSIKTRHMVTISLEDPDLDPSVFMITENGKEIENSTRYISTDKGLVLASEYSADKDGKALAVVYYIIEDVLDGVGEPLSADGLSGVAEVENAVQKTSTSYTYDLGMDHNAGVEYEKCKINIELEVQAMQYRNTTGSDWVVLFNDNIAATAQ
jgi:hypothetical protein